MTASFRIFLFGLCTFLFGFMVGAMRAGSDQQPSASRNDLERSYADGWNDGARFVSQRTKRENEEPVEFTSLGDHHQELGSPGKP